MKNWMTYKELIFCLVCILLQACSAMTDNLLPESPEKDRKYIELSLFPDVESRTQIPEEEGSKSESTIRSVDIYLREPKADDLIYIGQTFVVGTTARILVPPTVPEGEYYLYVVANANFTPMCTRNDFKGRFILKGYSPWESNHFLMANTTNDLLQGINDEDGGVKITISKSDDVEVTVKLERLAVKVDTECGEVNTEKITTQTIMGEDEKEYPINSVEVVETALVNCVNSFHLIQQWNDQWGNQSSSYPLNLQLVTPSSDTGYSMKDGYYNRVSDGNIQFVPQSTTMYCLENNSPDYTKLKDCNLPSDFTKMKGRVTAVMFKTRIIWEGVNGDNTLYRFGNKLFASVSALRKSYPNVQEDNEGVKCYRDGYMYHLIWLVEDGYLNKEGKPYYAVMRNTWFKLDVNTIGWGKDSPDDGYEEEDPIDEEMEDIGVTIKVNQWTIHSMEHTLQ